MKKFLFSFLLILISGSFLAFGEARILKNIFPQNYTKLTELDEDRAREIVSNCGGLIAQTVDSAKVGKDFSFATVFSQQVIGRKIYRILITAVDIEKLDFPTLESATCSENDFHWLQSTSHAVLQVAVEKTSAGYSLLASDVTGLWKKDNSGTSIYFSDFLISADEGSTKIMHLSAKVPVFIGSTRDGLIKATFKTRGTGLFGSQSAEDTLIEDGIKSTVSIEASDFLADRLSPIKHSILSAFDKNPKTCYKENSEENTITLQFTFDMDRSWLKKHGKIRLTQASIINGDSSGRNEYFTYDRIGTVTAEAWNNKNEPASKETSSFTLKDYSLEKQGVYLPFSEGKNHYILNASEIIKATKHDLSISEFDLKIAGYGWIF